MSNKIVSGMLEEKEEKIDVDFNTTTDSRYCKSCNYNVGNKMKFCPKCGTKNDEKENLNAKVRKKEKLKWIIGTMVFIVVVGVSFILSKNYLPKDEVADVQYIAYEEDSLWGYMNEYGEIVIEPKFNEAYDFSEELGLVRTLDGLYGYINANGEYVIEPQFEDAGFFSEGLAAVCSFDNGLYGYINANGEYVIEPQFEGAGFFSEGLASVRTGILIGYINANGEYIIEPQFHETYEFSEGLAAVCSSDNGLWGYINVNGEYVIEPQFEVAYGFSEGIAEVYIDGEYRYINEHGEYVD